MGSHVIQKSIVCQRHADSTTDHTTLDEVAQATDVMVWHLRLGTKCQNRLQHGVVIVSKGSTVHFVLWQFLFLFFRRCDECLTRDCNQSMRQERAERCFGRRRCHELECISFHSSVSKNKIPREREAACRKPRLDSR